METYYTVEEKFLQAVEEVNYGEPAKGLQLLKEIVEHDPFYARAHFQLGKIYYYQIKDYQAAGYHFKTCMELEPSFPDVYFDYLGLVVFLNMEKLVHLVAGKSLIVPGVVVADIYDYLGLFYEQNNDLNKALDAYRKARQAVTCKSLKDEIEESLARVKGKLQRAKAYRYSIIE